MRHVRSVLLLVIAASILPRPAASAEGAAQPAAVRPAAASLLTPEPAAGAFEALPEDVPPPARPDAPGETQPLPARTPPAAPTATPYPAVDEAAGLARAAVLLTWAANHPNAPEVPRALNEARALVGTALGAEAESEGVLRVFSAPTPESRRAALALLAEEGRPRWLPLYAYLSRRDIDVGVRVLAVELIGQVRAPEAERVTSEILRGNDAAEVRVAAATALARQGTPTAAEALIALALNERQPTAVREAARNALVIAYPERASRLPRLNVADSTGRGITVATGALSGSYTLALVGSLSPDAAASSVIGAFGGLVIGGAAAALLARTVDLDSGQATFLLGAGIWSVPVGWMLGALPCGPTLRCENALPNAIALATHVGTMTGAWMMRERLKPTVEQVLVANAATLAGTLAMDGLLGIPDRGADLRLGLTLQMLGTAGSFVAATHFAPRLRMNGPLTGLLAVAAAEGLLIGSTFGSAVIPSTIEGALGAPVPNPRQGEAVWAVTRLTVGLATGGVLASSAFWQPDAEDVLLLSYGAVAGNFLGAGLPLLFAGPNVGTGAQLGTALGGLAGAGLGLALRKPLSLRLTPGGALFSALGAAFVAAETAGWVVFLETTRAVTFSGERAAGTVMTATSLALAGLVALAQEVEYSPWQTAWLYSGAVWGAWLGGWGSHVLGARDQAVLASLLAGAGLGLAGSTLALSPTIGAGANTLAWMSVFGIGGMTIGSMGAVFAGGLNARGPVIAAANVVGSIAGLVLGAVLAPDLPGGREEKPAVAPRKAGGGGEIALPTIAPLALSDSSGRLDGYGAQLVWSL